MAALKAIPLIAEGIKGIIAAINDLRDAVTEKNIGALKSEVSSSLSQVLKAKSNDERRELIEKISKAMSK